MSQKICRTCLKKTYRTYKAHENIHYPGEPEKLKISDMLRYLAPEMYLGATLNPEICEECKNGLRSAYAFRKKCLDTEDIIGSFLKISRCNAATIELIDVLIFLDEKAKTKRAGKAEIVTECDGGNSQDLSEANNESKNSQKELKLRKELTLSTELGVFVDKFGNCYNADGVSIANPKAIENTQSDFLQITGVYSLNDESETPQKKTAEAKPCDNKMPRITIISEAKNSFTKPRITIIPEAKTDFMESTESKSVTPRQVAALPTAAGVKPKTVKSSTSKLEFNSPGKCDEKNYSKARSSDDVPAVEVKVEPSDDAFRRQDDEETLSACTDTHSSYGDIQDIIDNIPDTDHNFYVDIPEFVQINNFGLHDLQALRVKQQLRKEEADVTEAPTESHQPPSSDSSEGDQPAKCQPEISTKRNLHDILFRKRKILMNKLNTEGPRSARLCSVFTCKNTPKNSPDLEFYCFPTDNPSYPHRLERRNAWLKAVKLQNLDGSPWVPGKHSQICSRHFVGNRKSEDPRSPSFNPTIFLPALNTRIQDPRAASNRSRYYRARKEVDTPTSNKRRRTSSSDNSSIYYDDSMKQLVEDLPEPEEAATELKKGPVKVNKEAKGNTKKQTSGTFYSMSGAGLTTPATTTAQIGKQKIQSEKKCIVPRCPNSTELNPRKLFVWLPKNEHRRSEWCNAMGISPMQATISYVCEDHFDLPNDMENWLSFKTFGGRMKLKHNVTPHRYLTEPIPNEMIKKSQMDMFDSEIVRASKVQKVEPTEESIRKGPFRYEVEFPTDATTKPLFEKPAVNAESDSTHLNINQRAGLQCVYRNCNKMKRSFPDLSFFNFPYRKRKVCEQWVQNCECKNRGTKRCYYRNCRMTKRSNPELAFFTFPYKKLDLWQKWIDNCETYLVAGGHRCCYRNCENRSGRDQHISYFTFPKKLEMWQQWVNNSEVESSQPRTPNKKRRRIKIVAVEAENVGIKRTKNCYEDVCVLFTNYTNEGVYVNDHDYLVKPYVRNKVLLKMDDERLCMCFICGTKHPVENHVEHMNQHESTCKVCETNLGTAYMLNMHVRFHTYKCALCSQKVIYGDMHTHKMMHVEENVIPNNDGLIEYLDVNTVEQSRKTPDCADTTSSSRTRKLRSCSVLLNTNEGQISRNSVAESMASKTETRNSSSYRKTRRRKIIGTSECPESHQEALTAKQIKMKRATGKSPRSLRCRTEKSNKEKDASVTSFRETLPSAGSSH